MLLLLNSVVNWLVQLLCCLAGPTATQNTGRSIHTTNTPQKSTAATLHTQQRQQQRRQLKARVVVAKVNADEHRSLGERFDVRGFPTIKFFARGKAPSKDAAERCARCVL